MEEIATILFVCTGNSCRSPMAQAIFNKIARSKNLRCTSLSAGFSPNPSGDISKNAKVALAEIGIDFSHVPVLLNADLLQKSKYVFGLTKKHAQNIILLYPKFREKVFSFPIEIPDPYGGDIEVYRKSRDAIFEGINTIVEHLIKKQL